MRVGEAIRLDRGDYDPAAGVLTVRDTKFGKSRHLPLHPTAVTGLNEYLRLRDEIMPRPALASPAADRPRMPPALRADLGDVP